MAWLKPINDLLAFFKKHIYPASGQNTVDVQRLSCFESSKKTIQKGVRVDCRKDTAERVFRWNSLRQFQEGFEPLLLGVPKEGHILEAFAAGELRAQTNYEYIDELV